MLHSLKLALITGASSGIGESLAYLLAGKGINLILHGRNINNLERIAANLRAKVKVEIITAELNQSLERKKIIDKIYEKTPDLIINNAGFGLFGEALTYETGQQLEIAEVNGLAVLELTLEAARALASAEKKGVILNVSSSAGEVPIAPGLAVYSAAKAMVNKFSQSLDVEFQELGIRVLVACPGLVQTHFRQRAGGYSEPSTYQKMVMTSEYAAQEIWRQIEKEKRCHLFDWKTRLLVLSSKWFPTKWVAAIYRTIVLQRTPSRPLLKKKAQDR
jgi:short-subunit dehydrogenase